MSKRKKKEPRMTSYEMLSRLDKRWSRAEFIREIYSGEAGDQIVADMSILRSIVREEKQKLEMVEQKQRQLGEKIEKSIEGAFHKGYRIGRISAQCSYEIMHASWSTIPYNEFVAIYKQEEKNDD